jgi:hypothetical protein
MAKREPSRESTFWPWVIGIVVLALAVWAIAELQGRPGTDQPVTRAQAVDSQAASSSARAAGTSIPAADATITGPAFQVWVRDSAEALERAGEQPYILAGLVRLTAAVRWLARTTTDPGLLERADRLADQASRVDPGTPQFADGTRRVFMEAVAIVEAAHAAAGGTSEAVTRNLERARREADGIDIGAPVSEQRHRVYRYFDVMSEAVVATGRQLEEAR